MTTQYLYEETTLIKDAAELDDDLADRLAEAEYESFSWGADPADVLAAKQEADEDF